MAAPSAAALGEGGAEPSGAAALHPLWQSALRAPCDLLAGSSGLVVATWNMLADCYHHPEGDPDVHRWEERSRLVERVVQGCDAHLMCLQEVDVDLRQLALSAQGKRFCWRRRSGGKQDGCAFIWDPRVLTLLAEAPLRFDDQLRDTSASLSTFANFRRHNMAHIAIFRHEGLRVDFAVANVHLFWNPQRPEVKLVQARTVCAALEALRSRWPAGNLPVVLCGDLNSRPSSAVHTFLSRGVVGTPGGAAPDTRFLFDRSLNKLCRWVRMLGLDADLETAEEERRRTGKRDPEPVFRRCRAEGRVLVTPSRLLAERRGCPEVYLVAPHLTSLKHVLRDFFAHLEIPFRPERYLTICVKCNGRIVSVDDPQGAFSAGPCAAVTPGEPLAGLDWSRTPTRGATAAATPRRRVARLDALRRAGLEDGSVLDGLPIFECANEACRQVYWWSNATAREGYGQSSSARAKELTSMLHAQAYGLAPAGRRGGEDGRGPRRAAGGGGEGAGAAVEGEAARGRGTRASQGAGGGLLRSREGVLREAIREAAAPLPLWKLRAMARGAAHSLDLRVASEEGVDTNVTADFCGVLDYIFTSAEVRARWRNANPTAAQLQRTFGAQGGALPARHWPSDHLVVMASLDFPRRAQ